MALIKCTDCGKSISKKAKSCPSCGSPAQKKTSLFTKLIVILLAIIFLPSLVIDSYQSKINNDNPPKTTKIDRKGSETNGTLIPRSMFDRGKYYLLNQKLVNGNIIAVHKRVGVNSIGYTKTETQCKSMKMRELGYSETSIDSIPLNPSKWFELVDGSSKSDLANLLCEKT
jgi:primosomal protein N'